MNPRRRERRPPATLRTKTGCTNCRARRRKCDERHPTCMACSKRKLKCSWPFTSSQAGKQNTLYAGCEGHFSPKQFHLAASASATTRPVARPPRHTRLLPSFPPNGASEVDQELLDHYASKLCSLLLRNDAHPEFRRHFLASSILPRLQLMVDPLLACASLDLAHYHPRYRSLAMKYYSQAVTIIREKIAQKRVQGTEDWLLLNVLHLNLFETWNATTTTPVLSHIQGAAEILRLRGAISPGSDASAHQSTSDKVFARINVEAFIFHTINWSIFNGNPLSMPLNELWDFVEPYFATPPFPTASDAENSPVLGVPWQLYRFMSDLTQLTHRLPLDTSDFQAALALSDRLDAWVIEARLDNENILESTVSTLTFHYQQRARLFVIALRVILFKLIHHDTFVTDPTIQKYVSQAIRLIQLHVTERFHFWPLLLVGSAVLQREQADIIGGILHDISKTMRSATFLNVMRVLEAIWEMTITEDESGESMVQMNQYSPEYADGLDLLLGRDGVPGLINCEQTWHARDRQEQAFESCNLREHEGFGVSLPLS